MVLTAAISLFLLALYGILIDYYRRAWDSIPSPSSTTGAGLDPGTASSLHTVSAPSARTRISVLIPARNEEQNILNCLQSLACQSYPKELYEVIVIDDHSTDRTWEVLQSLHQPGLSTKFLRLEDLEPRARNGNAYKKWAIEAGVLASAGELIVTTDADCSFDPEWLGVLAHCYQNCDACLIAAPVRIGHPVGKHLAGQRPSSLSATALPVAHSLLSIFQTLDFITLQGITGASVHKRFHSMCNGANLAYKKETFWEVDGFRTIDSIPSGDDMLLMHKIYKKYPEKLFFLKEPRAVVTTLPQTDWKGFFNQRIRWASKADRYDDHRIFRVLLGVYLVNLLLLALFLASFWDIRWLWISFTMLALKTIMEYPFVRTVARFFGQEALMPYFPLLQPLHVLYTVAIGWLGKFGSYRWKDRKIKK